MPDIPLTHASDAQLARAAEENLFALFRAMTVLPGSELDEQPSLARHHTFPANPMFKGVWNTRLQPDEADDAIEETLAWFKARQASSLFWWIGPEMQPADLPHRLAAHGFSGYDESDPSMAVDLHALDGQVHGPEGFSIVQARDDQALSDWCDVFTASFETPPFAAQAWRSATLALDFDTHWQIYVGYLNGQPVASNLLFCGAGVAGLLAVGTVPEARGKGIGTTITLQPLLDARERGYRYGALFATPMGYPVYRRMGFRDMDYPIGRYLWRA